MAALDDAQHGSYPLSRSLPSLNPGSNLKSQVFLNPELAALYEEMWFLMRKEWNVLPILNQIRSVLWLLEMLENTDLCYGH